MESGSRAERFNKMAEDLKNYRDKLPISNKEFGVEIALRKKSEDALRQSEEKLHTLFESATDSLFILDLEGNIIDVNRTAYERLGYTKEEMLSMHISRLDLPEFTAKVPERIERINKHGEVLFESMHLRKDGTVMPVEVNARILDFEGRKVFYGIIRDITERKRAEEALIKSEERYHTFIDSTTDISFLKDDNFRFLIVNKAFTKQFGKKAEEIIGKTDFDLLPESVARGCRQSDIEALKSNIVVTTEEVVGDRIFEARKFRVRIGDDKFGVGAYIRDITEHKSAEKELRRHKEYLMHLVEERTSELQRVNEMLVKEIDERKQAEAETLRATHLAAIGELAAGIAHEINNPINGVINYAQILANKMLHGSKEEDIARRIIKEGDRISEIVSGLLFFARQRKDEKIPVRISEILAEILTLSMIQIRKDNILLDIDIPESLPLIMANPQQLQQVFLNVINNARYALNRRYPGPHDNKKIEVQGKVVTVDDTTHMRISFLDYGTGISSEILHKVVNPFFTTKPLGDGTGLGLSISYGIINDHGGALNLESEQGKFTRVIINLPIWEKDGK